MKLLICGPIPALCDWLVTADLPAGYLVLRSITISPRSAGKTPGTSLVRAEDIQAPAVLPADVQRLLAAWARCDAAGRSEVLKIAEVLAGVTP